MDMTGGRTVPAELPVVENSLTMHGSGNSGLGTSVPNLLTSGLTGWVIGWMVGATIETFDVRANPIFGFDLV